MSEQRQRQVPPPTLPGVLLSAASALGAGDAGWLIGGSLRDELLGLVVKDVDIAIDGDAEAFSRRLADDVGGAVYSASDAFGTWRVVLASMHIDVAPLRVRPGERLPADRAERLVADLRARDLTINALARPLTGGDIVDPLGGLADLRARRLKPCSDTSFRDDPLRVIRMARLSRGLRFTPTHSAVAAAAPASALLARVSGERLREELSMLLAIRDPAGALRDLADWGALAVVLPEVDALRGVVQNDYHHHDVFGHTLEALGYVRGVVEQLGGEEYLTASPEAGLPGLDRIVPVSWAVLLHDIGKPAARDVGDDGRITFWRHDEIGSSMAADVAARLRMSSRLATFLRTLIRQHLRLGFLVREQPLTRRALTRYRRDVSPWVFESVVVSLCDRLATRGDKTSPASIARHYRLARTAWATVSKRPIPRLLTGEEVMELLHLEPGPPVGAALDALGEEIEAGDVTTPEQARSFLLTWWQSRGGSGPHA
jgi:tRNA nucleotidyltransferase/poly(A) polymerase